MTVGALIVAVGLPFAVGIFAAVATTAHPRSALRASLAAAVALTLLATITPVDVAIGLPSGRALLFSPLSQLGMQILGLAALGLTFALVAEDDASVGSWLPVMWFHIGGLVVALLLNTLPLAFLVFTASTLLWVFGLPEADRRSSARPVLRYAALVSLAMPLLLGAFRLADDRLTSEAGRIAVETTVLALALPGFGLVLGLIPLHAWTLTLAAGAPRPMLFGVLGPAQTAAFILFLRTVATHEWLFRGAYGSLVTYGGALTALIASWLALSADPDDPDDWLAFAVIANMGMLMAGMGTGSRTAGTGVAMLLLARVLALVLLAIRAGASHRFERLADGVATLTLAGTPGLAGFPGLFLILVGVRGVGSPATVAVAAGSGLLFATALRRGFHRSRSSAHDRALLATGRDRAVLIVVVLLVVLGLFPQLVAGALLDPLRDIFFPDAAAPFGGLGE